MLPEVKLGTVTLTEKKMQKSVRVCVLEHTE